MLVILFGLLEESGRELGLHPIDTGVGGLTLSRRGMLLRRDSQLPVPVSPRRLWLAHRQTLSEQHHVCGQATVHNARPAANCFQTQLEWTTLVFDTKPAKRKTNNF